MSSNGNKAVMIMMADDDEDDRLLVKEAFEENRLANPLCTVEDGEQLMDYLHRKNGFENAVRPSLILLDLNMPRKSGFEALHEIKSDPELRSIPVIILTTSKAEEDIVRSYELGVNSFIVKPVTFEALVETIRELGKYWFQIVELPNGEN